MNRYVCTALLAFLLTGGIPPAWPEQRAAPALLQQIEGLQKRADRIEYGKNGNIGYQLAKARTWLDLALSEYHENETIDIVPAAIAQAKRLIEGLENNPAGLSMDTPEQVEGSEAVRPDLWGRIAMLKKQKRFPCGELLIAEAEVQLVWAGHEKYESSWEHARSYANNAEDLVNQAQFSIDKCAAADIPAPEPVVEKLTLSSDTVFEFGSSELDPSSLWKLNQLADNIRQFKTLDAVELIGHTDRLRSDGHPERNQLLSEQRAESIKQYLTGKGIPAEKIHPRGSGSSQPLVECPDKQSKQDLIACLQPNRRVEIILHGVR